MLGRFRSWLGDWFRMRRLGKCFERLKSEQLYLVGFPRFYLITKCPELSSFNPDWKQVVLLFHMHHSTVGFDDHVVISFLRWLRD